MTPQGNQHWESLRAISSLDPQKQTKGTKEQSKNKYHGEKETRGGSQDPLVVTRCNSNT